MRLIAVSMIRNEADILPDFLGHCAALFDELLVIDHASTDGTSEILAAAAARLPIRVWQLRQQAKAQSLVMSTLARLAVARGADWVFPLDADEFPAVGSRATLLKRLADAGPLAAWRWRNLWPGTAPDFTACRLAGQHESAPSRVRKIAVARRLIVDHPDFAIHHGSHAAAPGLLNSPAEKRLGALLHVPVRSLDRLRLKIVMNLAANALRPDRRSTDGKQYASTAARMTQLAGAEGAALRRRLALGYPELGGHANERQIGPCDFMPAGTAGELPKPVTDLEDVLARDATLRWRAMPDTAPWLLQLDDGEARLVAR
jgi:hypothetical protein